MPRWSLLASFLFIAAARADAPRPQPIDLTAGYDRFAAEARGAPTRQRREAFDRFLVAQHPEAHELFLGDPDAIDDARFVRITDLLFGLGDDIRDYRRRAMTTVPAVAARMEAALGARLRGIPVFLAISLFRSNGQVRPFGAGYAVMLGLDSLSHDDRTLLAGVPEHFEVFVAHELFHVHHWQTNASMAAMARRFLPPASDAPIWAHLWSEGLAACASRALYPDAPIDRVLSVGGIWDAASPQLARLAGELLGLLERSDPQITADWFYLNSARADLPDKSGYVVGLVVAHLIVREQGLERATRLEGEDLLLALRGAIARLAGGEAGPGAADLCVRDSGRA